MEEKEGELGRAPYLLVQHPSFFCVARKGSSKAVRAIILKHLIGLEPIIFCFEGNCYYHLAKDVKFIIYVFSLYLLY